MQHNKDQFRFHPTAFCSQLKSQVGNIFVKATTLRIKLIIDVAPIASRAHTHPFHAQTSRLLSTGPSQPWVPHVG